MTGMYLDLMESLARWFESRGSARKDALVRAGVAFSICLLTLFISVTILLDVEGGIPVVDWVSDHSWSIWLATAVIALIHWPITLRLRTRDQSAKDQSEPSHPSRYLWCWYYLPVLALFIASAMIAIANSSH